MLYVFCQTEGPLIKSIKLSIWSSCQLGSELQALWICCLPLSKCLLWNDMHFSKCGSLWVIMYFWVWPLTCLLPSKKHSNTQTNLAAWKSLVSTLRPTEVVHASFNSENATRDLCGCGVGGGGVLCPFGAWSHNFLIASCRGRSFRLISRTWPPSLALKYMCVCMFWCFT